MPELFSLTEAHEESFYRDGYFLAPRFIAEQTVAQINDSYAEAVAELTSKEWTSLGFSETAQALLKTPRMVAMFEQLLGGPTRLWLGMYAVVAPGGRGLAWHQDNMYTHILGHMLNAFVALDRIDSGNAGLWISPRSHLLGRQANLNAEGHRRAATPAETEILEVPPMAPGDAVIFHRELLHHSKTNISDRPRRAFAFQVSSASCRYAESGKLLTDRELLQR